MAWDAARHPALWSPPPSSQPHVSALLVAKWGRRTAPARVVVSAEDEMVPGGRLQEGPFLGGCGFQVRRSLARRG